MAVKVAINGLGRIGRCVARIIADRDDIELVAVNASGSDEMIEYNLKYDSVHGTRDDVKVEDGFLFIGNEKAKKFATRDLSELDFASCGAEIVIECTGAFLTKDKVQPYLDNGVAKVLFSAPAKDDTATFVIGANEDEYAGESVVSNASCTTNGLAPVAKVLDDTFGIEKGLMTTIHSYTASQPILDAKHKKDPRKGRSGATNLVPTTTGAAKAVGKVIPDLNGKMDGMAIRIPTPTGSLVDLVVNLKTEATKDEINAAMKEAAEGPMKGILEYTEDPIVSVDIIHNAHSSIFDAESTMVQGKTVKVLSWYDNEWGYSSRVVDLIEKFNF